MSCERCETAQELRGPQIGLKQVLIRIESANIELVGCEQHVKDAVAVIRIGSAHLHYLIEKGEILDKRKPASS